MIPAKIVILNCNNRKKITKGRDIISNSVKWITAYDPPETTPPDQLLLVTVSTIINTENGFESSTNTYPATIQFNNVTTEWHIIDGPDSYTLVCDKDRAVLHNIVHDSYRETINDTCTFENTIRMVMAWSYMPNPYGASRDKTIFVLTGYNCDTNSHTIILENNNMNMLIKQTRRILDVAKTNKEFPFETPDGLKFDWLEIYDKQKIGQLNLRLCYTTHDYELKLQLW